MDFKVIDDYFESNIYKPMFVVVGDKEYQEAINYFNSRAVTQIKISDFCRPKDKKPDLDAFMNSINTADVSYEYNKVVVLGLGEYLALQGPKKANEVLAEFVNYNLGSARLVLLLRCVSEQAKQLLKKDNRLIESGRIHFGDDLSTSIKFIFADPNLNMYQISGIKSVFHLLENGKTGEIEANTLLRFQDSLLEIKYIYNSYEAISKHIDMHLVPKECGTEEEWEHFLADLVNANFKLNQMPKFNEFISFQDSQFHHYLYGDEYQSWVFYIYLLMNTTNSNSYLKYALTVSRGLADFKKSIINSIIDIKHDDVRFAKFYIERKQLLSTYPEAEMAAFAIDNRVDIQESVYKLTDNTKAEKQEIIRWIAKYGIPNNLDLIYFDLYEYLKKYNFVSEYIDPKMLEILTDYFEEYKKLKLRNTLSPEFLKKVDDFAIQRIYNYLPKRDELLKRINITNTQLFWIDALGVEYMSYIVELAKQRGLAMSVNIGRADLPTITCENSGFFNNWPATSRHPKEERLDEIKHKEKGGYYYSTSDNPFPVHLAEELMIIRTAIEEITTTLESQKFEKVILTSDHGASRLAVLRNKEEKYETETKGQHSGRCCTYFPDCNLPYAIKEEEKGYIVLADYGRFKGSRAANVEVHGGASLEEVVVPVIEFSLKDNSIEIKLIDADNIIADYKHGIVITLYINKIIHSKLTLGIVNNIYTMTKIDDNHYSVKIPNISRAGEYPADVYQDEVLIYHLNIKVKGKTGSTNSDFDDLF